MLSDRIVEILFVLSIAAIVYHHVGYPLLLRHLARTSRNQADERPATTGSNAVQSARLPTVTMIIPAHNESAFIAAKIQSLARLDYPRDRFCVVIALDGCTDETKAVAEAAIARAGRDIDIRLVEYATNRGKIAVLNEQIGAISADVIALSDASALIDVAALTKAAAHFADPKVGVVCGTYQLSSAGSEGERKYWEYQVQIKADEAAVAAPMGAHGALYFFRRRLWQPLPADTINDDFVLPMRIVAGGYRAVYDRAIVATEIEQTESEQEFQRRVRIGAGNMQQLIRLMPLANPRSSRLAFVFLSGKGLRPIVPFLILLAVLATAVMAWRGDGLFQLLLSGRDRTVRAGRGRHPVALGAAATTDLMARLSGGGHTASALGALAFLTGRRQSPWRPAAVDAGDTTRTQTFTPYSVEIGKRVLDIGFATAGLVVLAAVFVPIAVAIKIESRGPVFYRQLRVGRTTAGSTRLFNLLKFRSMVEDAEARSGGPGMRSTRRTRSRRSAGSCARRVLTSCPSC